MDFDAPNPGTTRVGYEERFPARPQAAFNVFLLREKTKLSDVQLVKELNNWFYR